MQNQNQTNNSSSRINVPGARQALNNMKQEIANELGVNLKQGYNGDLTSRQAGSVFHRRRHGQEDDRAAGAPDERPEPE